MRALIFARGLKVVCQLGQQQGAFKHLGFQPVALGLHLALILNQMAFQRVTLAQKQKKRQQADDCHGRHADAVKGQ